MTELSGSLLARDLAVCWHPYTQHLGQQPLIPVASAKGAYLIDADGRHLLDAISSWWVTVHGHGHPAIAEAVAEHVTNLDHVIYAGCTHEPAVGLAEDLLRRLPGDLSRIFYSDDGSTAVEVALKMAVQYWQNRGTPRHVVVALEHAYHGDTIGAMSVSARGLFTTPFHDLLFQVERLPPPESPECLPALERLLEQRGNQVAVVIVEPLVQAAAGMRLWGEEALQAIARMVQSHDILLIADEVMTGFGRTGPLFACERAHVAPDIICLSKGLTGGVLPLGVTAAREPLFEAFLSGDRRHTFFHGHSYTANPIACAAARASLRLFDDASDAQRTMIGSVHQTNMAEIATAHSVLNPRVLGTIAAFDLAEPGGYLSPVGQRLAAFARERGVFIRPLGSTVYLLPPYCITADELASIYHMLHQFLESQ